VRIPIARRLVTECNELWLSRGRTGSQSSMQPSLQWQPDSPRWSEALGDFSSAHPHSFGELVACNGLRPERGVCEAGSAIATALFVGDKFSL
jgi:hypothetical protein